MSATSNANPMKKPLRILIVDDEFFSRQFLKDTLSPYGQVDIAVNGKETVEAFRIALDAGKPYGLICLDLLMPIMDGQETLTQIRQIEEDRQIFGLDGVKVIVITGVEDDRNVIYAFNTGCEGYIKKPIDEDKLLKIIKDLGLID